MKNKNYFNNSNFINDDLIDKQSENKIKCPECNLKFDNAESMSLHYLEFHDKIKEKLKLEELKRQEDIKMKEELKRKKWKICMEKW